LAIFKERRSISRKTQWHFGASATFPNMIDRETRIRGEMRTNISASSFVHATETVCHQEDVT